MMATLGLVSSVDVGEETSSHQFRLECLEIVGADVPGIHFVMFPVVGPADEADPIGIAVEAEGRSAGQADGLYAGQGCDTSLDLPLQPDQIGVFGVGDVGSDDAEHGQVIGLEIDVHVQQPVKAFAQQAGADQQHHGDGEFNHDQVGAETPPEAASSSSSALS